LNNKLLQTAVSHNGEARDFSEMEKILFESFSYIYKGLVLVQRHFLNPFGSVLQSKTDSKWVVSTLL